MEWSERYIASERQLQLVEHDNRRRARAATRRQALAIDAKQRE